MNKNNKGSPIEIWLRYCEDCINILIEKGSNKSRKKEDISNTY